MEQLPATLHTFGFGYSLRSGLLKSIAEIGGGNYAFIPDAGMIGTVFVHAVANLQATYATNATLTLTYKAPLQLEETTGASVIQEQPDVDEEDGTTQLRISLGNLQYGQSRDIYLAVKTAPQGSGPSSDPKMGTASIEASPTIYGSLSYSRMKAPVFECTAQASILKPTTLPAAEIAYNQSRSQICTFLSSLFPLRSDGEHEYIKSITDEKKQELRHLIDNLPSRAFADGKNRSLVEDLHAPEPNGQISIALVRDDYYFKWGVHYLPSVLNAHTRQICNSFKDSGPLQYGKDSPLFIQCRDRLDNAFDRLPAPSPSNFTTYRGVVNMSIYNNASGACFAGSTPVKLASGQSVPIRRLRRGMAVQTPLGSRRVAAVLKTPVRREVMCKIGDMLATPWHPVSVNGGKSYVFPATLVERPVRYTGAIFSVMLQRDRNADAHAISVGSGGVWGVTLGHGLTVGRDVRAHAFFGSYAAVGKALQRLGVRKYGLVVGGGVIRRGGRVCGFRAFRTSLCRKGLHS
jgi:hypothetical protein